MTERDDEEIEYSTEIEDMMLEIAWKDYDYCFTDKNAVENKVSILLAANGIFLGIISTISKSLNPVLLPYGYLTLCGSIFFAIYALKFRNYNYIRPLSIWKKMKDAGDEDNPYRAKRALFKTIDIVTNKNRNKYNEIVKFSSISLYLFALGLIIFTISFLVPCFCLC